MTPDGCRTVSRFARSASSRMRTLAAAATSAGSAGPDRDRPAPPAEHGNDPESAAGDEQLGRRPDHVHPGRVQAHLLGRLPQGGLDRAGVPGLDRAAGEGGLAAVPAQPGPALDEQQIRSSSVLIAPTPGPDAGSEAAPGSRPPAPPGGGRSSGGTGVLAIAAASSSSHGGGVAA